MIPLDDIVLSESKNAAGEDDSGVTIVRKKIPSAVFGKGAQVRDQLLQVLHMISSCLLLNFALREYVRVLGETITIK